MTSRGESVLLIVLDTVRYDSIFGPADTVPAPRLRRRAEAALVYSRAYSPASWTLPSFASLFTGALPSNHGAISTALQVDPSLETLAEIFAGAGRRTSLFTCNSYLSSVFGLTQGFEGVFSFGPALSSGEFVRHRPSSRRRSREVDDRLYLFDRLLLESREFFKQKLSPHGLQSNSPDQGGAEACTAVARWLFPKGFKPAYGTNGLPEIVNPNRWHYLLGLEPFEKLEKLRQWYLAGVSYDDRITDRLLSELDSKGVLENTWVVITSDHGEAFGENGTVGHGTFLTEELLHVPLIVVPPEGAVAKVGDPVSLIDLHHALRRLASNPSEPWRLDGSRAIVAEDFGIPRFLRATSSRTFETLQRLPLASGLIKRAWNLTITRRAVIADGYRLEFEDGRPPHLQRLGDSGLVEVPVDAQPAVISRLQLLLADELKTKTGRRIKRLKTVGGQQLHPELLPRSAQVQIAEEVVTQALNRFRNAAILWTGGKDSTLVLWIVREICTKLGRELPPAVFIDHGMHFSEVSKFMHQVQLTWGVKVIVARNDGFLSGATTPGKPVPVTVLSEEDREVLRHIGFEGESVKWDLSTIEGNHLLKTFPMNQIIRKHGFDSLFTGIRRDETEARIGESFFSPRHNPPHVRVHPILMFSERAVWDVTLENGLPICPLYAHGYRSFDAEYDTTKTAATPAWEQDLDSTPERAGRGQDKEGIMRRLRELGYM